MSDPVRFSEDDDPESAMARTLLRSARGVAPRAARNRAFVAATTAVATTSLSAGGAAAGGLVGKVGAVTAIKWLGAAAFVGATAVGAVAIHRHVRSASGVSAGEAPRLFVPVPSPSVASPATRGGEPSRIELPPVQPTPELAPAEPLTSPASPPPQAVTRVPAVSLPPAIATSHPSSASSVHDEVAALQGVSEALERGETAAALSELGAYERRFPEGAMSAEGAVLRIEALARSGDLSTARRAAERFLATQPQSPYAERVRTVVGANP